MLADGQSGGGFPPVHRVSMRSSSPRATDADTARNATDEEGEMGLFGRRRKRGTEGSGTVRTGTSDDAAHLEEFIRTHLGVEAFVEPRTTVTDTTIMLVAHDGEWTRRRIDGPNGAVNFAKRQAIPLYDAAVVGYPQRMRDYNARKKSG